MAAASEEEEEETSDASEDDGSGNVISPLDVGIFAAPPVARTDMYLHTTDIRLLSGESVRYCVRRLCQVAGEYGALSLLAEPPLH